MGYSVINVEEIEGSGPSGTVRFVRRELGVEAFGINWFELAPGAEGHEHDEAGSGQEEVSVVVQGWVTGESMAARCRSAWGASSASIPNRCAARWPDPRG